MADTETFKKFDRGINKILNYCHAIDKEFRKMLADDYPKNKKNNNVEEKPLSKKQMSQLSESLKRCRVEGNILYLPSIQEGMLDNYAEVKKALMNAGAKYKRNTFVFPNEAQPYIDRLTGGEKINIKKSTQSFFTPSDLADEVIDFALIKEGHRVLEPQAGQGALIKAIYRKFPRTMEGPNDKPCVAVDFYELDDINLGVLSAWINTNNPNAGSRTSCMGKDFLKATNDILYDRIVANPPFAKNADIIHIRKMYDLLKNGGRMVSIASRHWQYASGNKEKEFREWLTKVDAIIHNVDAGRFKSSGTMISTCVIIINK